jgi:LysM repeat protein
MKKVIRLTESELIGIVKRVMSEQIQTSQLAQSVFDTQKLKNAIMKNSEKDREFLNSLINKSTSAVTVKQGDTLSGIAKKFGLTLDQLVKLNPGIDNPNKIFTGQKIKIK